MSAARRAVFILWAAAIATVTAGATNGQTLKERLSDKASDQQRVDDCRVPPERRGPVRRPDCPPRPPAAAQTRQP
jgi:hypothetical protein